MTDTNFDTDIDDDCSGIPLTRCDQLMCVILQCLDRLRLRDELSVVPLHLDTDILASDAIDHHITELFGTLIIADRGFHVTTHGDRYREWLAKKDDLPMCRDPLLLEETDD